MELRRSPLHDIHVGLGAKMVEFGGWEMPLSYPSGTLSEHKACRSDAVAFDVSHLGTVHIEGSEAFGVLQEALSNDLRKIAPGKAQYTHLLTQDGFVLDDIIVWWLGKDCFDVMPNASNTERVLEAIGGVDTTATRVVIAMQGPLARKRLSEILPDAANVGRFCVKEIEFKGEDGFAAGTGYTGEDGIECCLPIKVGAELFSKLPDLGFVPAGLGARDTLRLEAGLPLHGHELGSDISPLEAGLSWVVGWDKASFCGRDALVKEKANGPKRRLVGIKMQGRQPPRPGCEIFSSTTSGLYLGEVTSGNFSPMLEKGIALGFIDTSASITAHGLVHITVRGRTLPGNLCGVRFWPSLEVPFQS